MKKFNVVIYVPSVQVYSGVVEAENEQEAELKALNAEWVEGSDTYTVDEEYVKEDEVEVVITDFEE
jgi:hypothetical protein